MEPIRFGVIGLGMGMSRARTIFETEGAELVAVSALEPDRRQRAVEQFGCEEHADYLELLDRDDIDVAMIMSYSGLHADMGIEAAKRGKHVITTKPMDITVAKCDALIEACEKAGVKLLVDFGERYREVNRKIKKAMDLGVLGKPILGEVRLKWWRAESYYEGWHGTWALDGGGSAMNQGVHQIDLLQWFLGRPTAVYGRFGVYAHRNVETEDLAAAFVDFENGALGVILTTTTMPKGDTTTVEIHGDRGAILAGRGPAEWVLPDDAPALDVPPGPRNVIEDALAVLNEGAEPACDGHEGRKSVELVCALYESGRRGEKVTLPPR